MTKAEAFETWRKGKLGLSLTIREREEAGFIIQLYGLKICKAEHLNRLMENNPCMSFAEDEIAHLLSL